MSREGVRLVEAAHEALSSRGLEAFAEYWADDVDWQAVGGRWRGKDAGRRYMREWFEFFDDFTTELLEVIDAGDERVVAWIRVSGRAKGSGIEPPPQYFSVVFEVRDGKIARAWEYATLDEAVEAAGASR
jgi:ketosteroid isomerase-like protein